MTGSAIPRLRRPLLSLIDRYLLRQLAGALAVCLGTLLTALLLERLLRLFGVLAQNNQALPAVAKLIFLLVPHYLGLALPGAFFVALFIVVSRLGDHNELDACLGCGLSIASLTRPFIAAGVVLMLFSALLFGYLQPYARYQYHAVMFAALNAGWDARLQAGTFANAGNGYTLTSDEVDPSGRQLSRVFVRRVFKGHEEITTGETGSLQLAGGRLVLKLRNGEHEREEQNGERVSAQFNAMSTSTEFSTGAPPFVARGRNERELTFGELLHGSADSGAPELPYAKRFGELQGRLARTLSLPLLPLLAVPMALSAKRGKRTASMVVATVLMLLFHHALQLGESLAESGKVSALLSVWGPFLVFAGLCAWLFTQSLARPGDNPVTRGLQGFEHLLERIPARWRTTPAAR